MFPRTLRSIMVNFSININFNNIVHKLNEQVDNSRARKSHEETGNLEN